MLDIITNVLVSMSSQFFTMVNSLQAVANGRIYMGKVDADPAMHKN